MAQHFQDYTLTSTLERRASSTTYLAVQDQRPTRSVVLKLFHNSGFTNAAEQEKFLEETEKFSLLSNPMMVPIIEAGIENDQPYIVSEYMPNGSLRVRLDRAYPQRLPIQQAMIIITQIGQGLAYLHARYMLHGQLKPEHILFTTNGRALLSDPYCATTPAPWDADNENARDAYRYLAPEQFAGKNSPRSDQYALCCVAYELLTGRPPFTSREPQTLKEQQLRAIPSPISPILPDLPTTIERAILKGLAKEPSQRHTDIVAFLTALQSSKTATAPDLPLPRAMRRTRSLVPPIPIAPQIPPKTAKKPAESEEHPKLPQTSPAEEDIFAPQFKTQTPTPGIPKSITPTPIITNPIMPTPRMPNSTASSEIPKPKTTMPGTPNSPNPRMPIPGAPNPTTPTPRMPDPTTSIPTNNPPRNNRLHMTGSQPALSPDNHAPRKNVPDRTAATPSSDQFDPQARKKNTDPTAPVTNPPVNRIPNMPRSEPPAQNNNPSLDDLFEMASKSSSTSDGSQSLDDLFGVQSASSLTTDDDQFLNHSFDVPSTAKDDQFLDNPFDLPSTADDDPSLNHSFDTTSASSSTSDDDQSLDDIFNMMASKPSRKPDTNQPLADIPNRTAATPPSPAPAARQSSANIDNIFDETRSLPQEPADEAFPEPIDESLPDPADEAFDDFMQDMALDDLLNMLDQPSKESKPTTPFNIQPPAAKTNKRSDYVPNNYQEIDAEPEIKTPQAQKSTSETFNNFLQELSLEDEQRKVNKDAQRKVNKNTYSQPRVAPEAQPAPYSSTPLIVPNSNLLSYDPTPITAQKSHLLQPATTTQPSKPDTVTTAGSKRRWRLFSLKTLLWSLVILLMIGTLMAYTAFSATSPKASSLTQFNNLLHPTPKSTVDQLGILPSATTASTATVTTTSQTPGATSSPTPTATPASILLYSNTVSTQSPATNIMVLAFVPALTVTDTRIEGDIVIHGNTGGILFRNSSKAGYSMRISTNGTYDLESASGTLAKGSSSAIKKGDNASNHLTIIAKGQHITISINGTVIINKQDSSASSGSVGILAINSGKSTTTNCALNIYTD